MLGFQTNQWPPKLPWAGGFLVLCFMNSKDGIHGQRQDMFRRDWELKGYRTPDKNQGTGSGRELVHLVGPCVRCPGASWF